MSEERQSANGEGHREEAVDRRRRRLTTAAAASVPAFFILRHRSVRAGTCEAPSSYNANTSLHPSGDAYGIQTCSGRSPGYWKTHPESWVGGYYPGQAQFSGKKVEGYSGGTLFSSVFLTTHNFRVREPAKLTLMDVLFLGGNRDTREMGAHFVAALLNVAAGLTPPLTVARVQEMWSQWDSLGYYSPPPGVDQWDAEDIKDYIESTWG